MRKSTPQDVSKLQAFIANNPGVQSMDLVRWAKENNLDFRDVMEQTVGATKLEKSGLSMDTPIEDMLNDIYGEDPTPTERYIIGKDSKNTKANALRKVLGDNLEVSEYTQNGARQKPTKLIVQDYGTPESKLLSIADAGHGLKHAEDSLIRPDLSYNPKPFKPGHHAGDIYEAAEAIKDVRGLPQDEKVIKEILKQSAKHGLKPSPFKKILSAVPVIGTAAGVGLGLSSGDATAAIPFLDQAENIGMSAADESDMLEQIDARKSYSPDMPEKDMARWNKIRNQLSK